MLGIGVFMSFAILVKYCKRDMTSVQSVREKEGTLIAQHRSKTWNHLNLVNLTNLSHGCV